MIRRSLWVSSLVAAACTMSASAAANPLLATHELNPGSAPIPAVVHCVTELTFAADAGGGDPFNDCELDVVFFSPLDGKPYPLPQPLQADAVGSCDVPRRPINQDWISVLTQPRS